MWRRIVSSLVAIAFSQFVATVGNVLLAPLYLAVWSPVAYGEWLALSSLGAYVGIFDFGLTSAAVNRLTQAFARRNLAEYRRYQHSAMGSYVMLASALACLSLVVAWMIPLREVLGLRELTSRDASWTLWFVSIQVLLALPSGFLLSTYRTTGNLAGTQWAVNLQQIATVAVVASVLLSGGGPRRVAAFQLLPLVTVSLMSWVHLSYRFPALVPGISSASAGAVRELARPSVFFFLITLAVVIAQQGSVVLLSWALGGMAVSVFVTSRTLANVVRQALISLNAALWPELTRLEAQREIGKLRSLHRLTVLGTASVCIGAAAVLWYEAGEIVTLWTGGRLVADNRLIRLLVLYVTLQAMWQASSVFTAAANRHHVLAMAYLLSAVIGIAAVAVLIRWFGSSAIPLGLLIGEAIACYHFVIKDTCRLVDEPYSPFALRLWAAFAMVWLAALALGWLGHEFIKGPALFRWLAVATLTFSGTISSVWAVCLFPEDRTMIAARLRTYFASGKAGEVPG